MRRSCLLLLVFALCCCISHAQLCTGSLGDPIVNITFGNSPSSLRPGVTNMTYNAADCPSDGSYTITASSTQCFSNTWFTLKDHTGDANGQFMLINASVTPNDFYVDTIRNLCSNTTFEFAAWVVNMLTASSCNGAGIKPNLTFRIETTTGTVLATYQTGDIPSANGQWRQYGTFFKTPAGISSVVIRLTNNAPGGCGNDLALDDITFRPCGPAVQASVRNQAGTTVTFCDTNNSLTMDAATAAGFSGSTIQWQVSRDTGRTWTDIPGEQSATYTRPSSAPGHYQYRTVAAESANFANVPCRVASNLVTVIVKAKPVFSLKNAKGCTGQNLSLETDNGAGYTYRWNGPNGYTSFVYNPVVTRVRYIDSGLYTVNINMNDGCSGIDSFYVNVFEGVAAQVSADTLICEGTPASLRASGGTSYAWTPPHDLSNPQQNNTTATPSLTTTYQVMVSNASGCKDSLNTTVTVWNNPVISAGADKILFAGGTVTLDGSATGNVESFYWSPTTAMLASNTLSPTVSPTDTVTYTLYVLPGQGCPVVSDDVFVFVYKSLNVPNAFSPNGDGINDVWLVKGLETYPGSVTKIYNRSGMLVFEGKSGASWDGTYKNQPVPIGTYYYLIDLHIGKPVMSGWIAVIR